MTLTRIGCAGWSIGREAAPQFGGAGSHLQRYARVLNAVEINSSFYRPHQPQTYQRWADSVPDDFRFSVKLPRSITHDRRLADSADLLDAFAAEAGALGHKLGCVLVQLPPSLALDAEAADRLWRQLRERFSCMQACEARHGSWFSETASALLSAHQVTRVIADPPAGKPGPYVATTGAQYIRLHGSPRIYASLYSEQQLQQVAGVMAGKDGWCIFDNTMSGQQTLQALRLQQLLASGGD
ncbi:MULTISPECIES: DUF72 domain-containing protein [unclassified Duganella]|uniref:DUF72 domain-containing protein n=1 Tax=unclassified Duganella TaxID=2636909 RepID=UPI000891671E|nr:MULTISPECIES: DUF72 domain-containing protein [unclassified Duganella]SDG40707.1 Uncharacterized conserved protein YecE, DUF72 family [Duganella sp. OV458]SDJ63220.1 Uncharacterized conserved protein YecE, DUF72 family [Duganella sp. OV510]